MIREALLERFERGAFDGLVPRFVERAWAMALSPGLARPVRVPGRAEVVTIGGATLGGSGKTPLALACTKHLARTAGPVVLIGHAYRARVVRPQFVTFADDVRVVGDEALLCARELADVRNARVAIGPTRQKAVDWALTYTHRLVLDGPLQIAPTRAKLAILAVSARAPFGAGACPPRGDLRAPIAALLEVADRVVAIGSHEWKLDPIGGPRIVRRAYEHARGAWMQGRLTPWEELAQLRLGLWTSIARPHRVLNALDARSVHPSMVLQGPDHRAPTPRHIRQALSANVEAWLCTAKCRMHLGDRFAERPLAVLDYDLSLEEALARDLLQAPEDV